MLRILRHITKHSFLSVNIVLAIMLCLSSLIPLVSPHEYWLIGILGLITPFIAAANIGFIVFWMLFKKWKFISIPVVTILVAWNVFSVGFAYHKVDQNKSNKTNFSLLSYNVRLLDLYKWSGKKSTRKDMLNYLKQKNADVLCLQEFFSANDSAGLQNVKDIAGLCNYKYYASSKNFDTKRGFFGDIIFSKYPIINEVSLTLDTSVVSHKFQYVDVKVKKDTIRVFNLHLASTKINKKDIAFLDVNNIDLNDSGVNVSKNILKKLKSSFEKRAKQVDVISSEIKMSPYSNIVCGDFNDIPSSYTYFKLRGQMNDAFLKDGYGLGRTYRGISPVLRIDYIFFDKQKLELRDFQLDPVAFSDHYPISAQWNL